jgi:DNA repair exonuclease SbcCD nuclease subunit
MKLIGDPHLGRDFSNGTPLNRRGEREAAQMEKFKTELATNDDMVVMIGDLWDKPFVPLPLIHTVADAVRTQACARPGTKYIFLAGNHDRSRQLDTRGAWDILKLAIDLVPNVYVLNEPAVIDGVAFFPWEWGRTATDQVTNQRAHIAVGHWDLQDFGGDTSHMCPATALKALGVEEIWSGHYHLAGIYDVNGVLVHCTGSMQPYTHAEDPEGELYVTLTAEEALERDDLRDKCVRILLEPGEQMPQIDCLQLTSKRTVLQVEDADVAVSLDGFDIHAVLGELFIEKEVPETVQTFIKERMGDIA